MRVVTGLYGGRSLFAPKGLSTRPMTDKVRAALFDSLGNIENVLVLDAYAGTGAVGIEALSRGAGRVVAVEASKAAIKVIRRNIEDLDIGWGYGLYEATIESWLARQAVTDAQPFDVIVADPPYDQLKPDVIQKLAMMLGDEGVLIVSHSSRKGTLDLTGVQLLDTKTYGDTALSFYKLA